MDGNDGKLSPPTKKNVDGMTEYCHLIPKLISLLKSTIYACLFLYYRKVFFSCL